MTTHATIGAWVSVLAMTAFGFCGCGDPALLFEILHHQGHSSGHGGNPPSEAGPSEPDAAQGGSAGSACAVPSDAGEASDAPLTLTGCTVLGGAPATGVCVPSAPFGWRGPGTLLSADTAEALPACATSTDSATALVLAGPPAPACQGCSCGTPEGLSCGAASAGDLYWDSSCELPCSTSCLDCGRDCVMKNACAFHSSFAQWLELKPAVLAAGSCAPSPPPAPPSLAVERAVRACFQTGGPVGSACSLGMQCGRTQGRVCLFHEGEDLACPRGPYREHMLFYAQTSDTRACTGCSCGGPQGVSCPTRIEVFGPPPGQCSGELLSTIETASNCLDLSGVDFSNSLHFVPGEPCGSGACMADGTATGAVTQSEPFTACCIPEGFTTL